MPAIREDVADAIKEGVTIDYLAAPVEILGSGTRVSGVRCQRMQLGEAEADGRRKVDPVPASEFVIEADHVVIAIGQEPNTPILNIKGLDIGNDLVVTVDPLTLETNIHGVFAGGDCVTGSNTVVDAMAAGLRSAESIDRYLKGRDLKKGRTLDAPKPNEVDIEGKKPSPYKRTQMPALHLSKRKGNYEETALGLEESSATHEAERCLNCATCCECMECEQACELKAIYHRDTPRKIELGADGIINFVSSEHDIQIINKAGVQNVADLASTNIPAQLAQASAAALSTVIDLKLKTIDIVRPEKSSSIENSSASSRLPLRRPEDRTVVYLCRCGDSIGGVIDLHKVGLAISKLAGVSSVKEITQACTLEGSRQIGNHVEQEKIAHVVLAACRCCNFEQICFSCSDRRVMCQNNLSLNLAEDVNTEFINIREQCAWVHKDDPEGATSKAIELISTGVVRAQKLNAPILENRFITKNILILGTGLSSLASAANLAKKGFSMTLISELDGLKSALNSPEYQENTTRLLAQLEQQGVKLSVWPDCLEINGAPGKYEAVIKRGGKEDRIDVGVIILDLINAKKEVLDILAKSNLLNRIMARQRYTSRISILDSTIVHSFTVRETAGVFIIVPVASPSIDEQITMGEAAAARASTYLSQINLQPRSSSVVIDAKLCRGCGDCSRLCPYIENISKGSGAAYAYVDPALCFGCGACIAVCPTGAIKQPLQSEMGITAALQSLLEKG
jgi:heterodisulfide reductase subunit A-like polyferredoxin